MSNIHGLNSLKNSNNDDKPSSDESGDEEPRERQGFFVGGSEHSGQQVLGPPGRRNPRNFVENLFDSARNSGAEMVKPEDQVPIGGYVPRENNSYQGGVFTLGGHGAPTEAVASNSAPQSSRAGSSRGEMHVVNFNVWTNGFSINDGPLRQFDDPANRPLLQAVSRGEVPIELATLHPKGRVDFHMVRKNVEYKPPKMKPFSGEGMRLGSVVPAVVGLDGGEDGAPKVENLPKEEADKLLSDAQVGVKVNNEEPTTRIQIRLPSNQTIVGTFNQTHTVDDVRSFVANAVPSMAFHPFQFMTTYPRATIEQEQVSLKESGLLNAAVVAKFVE